jgi:hypothetical protein
MENGQNREISTPAEGEEIQPYQILNTHEGMRDEKL